MEQMDNVTGGTVNETLAVWDAILRKNGKSGEIGRVVTDALHSIPVIGSLSNCAIAELTEDILKKGLHMDSYCSVGWFGGGHRQTHNWYKIGDQYYSTEQVVDMINKM